MVANLLLACAGACLTVASSTEAPAGKSDRILLSCQGTLVTAGQPPGGSPILTSGAVDLERRWVYGFGLGGIPVAYVTRDEVSFVSATVDGSLDRRTGRTTITMHSASTKSPPLMSLDLISRLSEPLS